MTAHARSCVHCEGWGCSHCAEPLPPPPRRSLLEVSSRARLMPGPRVGGSPVYGLRLEALIECEAVAVEYFRREWREHKTIAGVPGRVPGCDLGELLPGRVPEARTASPGRDPGHALDHRLERPRARSPDRLNYDPHVIAKAQRFREKAREL